MSAYINFFTPIAKWICSGGLAVLADLVVLYTLVEYFGVHYLVAASIAFTVSATLNYTISRLAIFTNSQNSITRSYTTFMSVSVLGLIALNIGLYLLVDIVGVHYLLARVLLAGTLGVSSFFLHKYVSFNDKTKMMESAD